MKIVVQNLNGMRSAHGKGLIGRLEKHNPDIFCMQEIRISKDQIPSSFITNGDLLQSELITQYHKYRNHGVVPGYAGTAVFSKIPSSCVTYEVGIPDLDNQGRLVVVEFDEFILINTYIPNGGAANAKVPLKIDYMHTLFTLVGELMKKKEVIFCGDFNVAHTEKDLAQPKQNVRRTGFLPEERAMLDMLISMGFVDVLRIFHPETPIYSRYSYRSKNAGIEIGWRFDYIFVTPGLISKIKSFEIPKFLDHSDHCPMIMEIDI